MPGSLDFCYDFLEDASKKKLDFILIAIDAYRKQPTANVYNGLNTLMSNYVFLNAAEQIFPSIKERFLSNKPNEKFFAYKHLAGMEKQKQDYFLFSINTHKENAENTVSIVLNINKKSGVPIMEKVMAEACQNAEKQIRKLKKTEL